MRERGVLGLEEAVRRMTSLSADTFGLVDRGRIKEGYWADLVLFDPATVTDTATYDDPKREPDGIQLVVVNGQVAYDGGQHTGVGSRKDAALPPHGVRIAHATFDRYPTNCSRSRTTRSRGCRCLARRWAFCTMAQSMPAAWASRTSSIRCR